MVTKQATMILYGIIGAVVGFVIGALVFRNNVAAGNELIEDLKQKIEDLKNKIDSKI